MRRIGITGLALLLAVQAFSGCGGNAKVPATVTSSVEKPSATPVPTEAQEIEITLAKDQELIADYTTMDGITLEKGSYIAVVAKGMNTSYWTAVKKGAKAAIAELNRILGYTGADKIRLTFEGPDDGTDVDAQINTLDTVLADNPTVLCLAAIDMQSCNAQVETAAENGIPVMVIDSGVYNELVQTACTTDNYAAGVEAAKRLCAAIGEKGQVAVMAHRESSQSSMDRVAGFTEEIEANHPEVELVQTDYEDKDHQVAEICKEVCASYPDLKGYFATNENTSEQIAEVLSNMEDTEIKFVGFDCGDAQIKAVKNGIEEGFICQNPYSMGYASMVAAARMAAQLPVDTYIDAGFIWVDKDNMDQPEIEKYLYK